MNTENILKNKHILIVDDEPDVLEFVSDEFEDRILNKASDYDSALQYLQNYTYDVVILDIMGVNGFELLKQSVSKGFPTVMLTAHALSSDSLKKSIKLGALSFLPKEKMSDIRSFIADVVLNEGKSAWRKLFARLGAYFDRRFGPDWKERDSFFKEFEQEISESKGNQS